MVDILSNKVDRRMVNTLIEHATTHNNFVLLLNAGSQNLYNHRSAVTQTHDSS